MPSYLSLFCLIIPSGVKHNPPCLSSALWGVTARSGCRGSLYGLERKALHSAGCGRVWGGLKLASPLYSQLNTGTSFILLSWHEHFESVGEKKRAALTSGSLIAHTVATLIRKMRSNDKAERKAKPAAHNSGFWNHNLTFSFNGRKFENSWKGVLLPGVHFVQSIPSKIWLWVLFNELQPEFS